MINIFDYTEKYALKKLYKLSIEDQVDIYNNNKSNDCVLFRFAVNSYIENFAYGNYVYDIIAKVKYAFGQEITLSKLKRKIKEYIDWAFSSTPKHNWCERYKYVHDEEFGHETMIDFSKTECYIGEDNLLYVREI